MKSRQKALKVSTFLALLDQHYAEEFCHLTWIKERPWTLLFAVILSAQCTDRQVNLVTPQLFTQFAELEDYWQKPLEDLEACIHSIGFFHSKAKYLRDAASKIYYDYAGQLPDSMAGLTSLPGVGRKTANVILWNIFGKNLGMVVDTHIGRISQRVGLTKNTSAEKIEQDLMQILPQESWGRVSHQLIQFGRDFCQAKKPQCAQCFLASNCPYAAQHLRS